MAVASSVATPERRRSAPKSRHVPGEPGLWLLLFGDILAFTILFGVYLFQRSKDKELFAASQDTLNRSFGALNTVILLTSSVLVVFAVRAIRTERTRHLAAPLMLGGTVIGACFVVVKVLEYHEKISTGITPATNDFYMYYFVLTGLHLVHVVIGLVLLLVLTRIARTAQATEPTDTQLAFFEGGGCFWHMVDLLWIVIFPLLFLVR
jgi:nitric oxide reductase NorE protein